MHDTVGSTQGRLPWRALQTCCSFEVSSRARALQRESCKMVTNDALAFARGAPAGYRRSSRGSFGGTAVFARLQHVAGPRGSDCAKGPPQAAAGLNVVARRARP